MQDMFLIDKQKQLFLRRKHKLFKSLAQPSRSQFDISITPQKDVINLYEMILNKQNHASQISYFIKHELHSDLTHHVLGIMDLLWGLLNFRSGSFICYITYRLCRKYPASYWPIIGFIQLKMAKKQEKSVEQVAFLTEIFLHGFSLSLQDFTNLLFPHYQKHILYLLPKYIHILQSNDFFSNKNQKGFLDCLRVWMEQYKTQIQASFLQLLQKGKIIQQNLITQKENEAQELDYISRLEKYETELYKFQNAFQTLNTQFNSDQLKLKSIFQLKKECITFKHSFQYSQYERQLYLSNAKLESLKPFKKSQMVRIEENQAFVTRIKVCSTIQQCVNLSGYFLEQMNIQHNREQLVQIIINECFSYNNISYILKILIEINKYQPSLYEYCCTKGRKICAQSRMNPKYQKLLCEMSRFNLLDQNILLEYSQKILMLQNNQVTKEVESILEQLGTIVYYRSLQTHTRINKIFQRMQTMMKNKLVHFNIEQIFHLKGLLNYLRNHSNKISTAQTQEIAQLQIKTNFQFILKKMQKLLKENEIKKIIQFISTGIDQQDFLNSYYYASLVRDLNQKQINKILHQHTLSSINSSLSQLNSQRSVCWSRFLGELYNYQIISRKKLVQNLNHILRNHQQELSLSSCLKSICATLQTSKQDLKLSQMSRDRKEVIYFLFELQKKIILNKELQKLLVDQISQIVQYFHPHLTSLDSIFKIQQIMYLSNQYYAKYNIYTLLDMMQSGVTMEELEHGQRTETKKRYQEKEKAQTQKKWVEKPIKYREKIQQALPRNDQRQSPSKESTKAEQVQVVVQKKKIKVMGRSKGDKKIKVVTCSYTDQINEP